MMADFTFVLASGGKPHDERIGTTTTIRATSRVNGGGASQAGTGEAEAKRGPAKKAEPGRILARFVLLDIDLTT